MSQITNIRITAPEIASLWTQYQNDSLAICVLKYLTAHTEDKSIIELSKYTITIAEKNIEFIKQELEREGYAIPRGFTNEDVNISARKLFGDCFTLHYLNNMTRIGILAYGLSLSNASREDIRRFYVQSATNSIEINEKVIKLMLEKGIYSRPPSIPPNKKVRFAEKQGFLGSIFKETRPLTVIEITNLFSNIQTNVIGKAVMTAFSQVADSPEVRNYFIRGKEIANKHINLFIDKLSQNDLTGCLPLEPLLTDSTQAPFSDKLMMFHTAALVQAGVANYGAAISTSQRYDLAIDYSRLMVEVGAFAEDGANIMIDKGWFEEPPQAVNRKELAMSH